MESTTKKTILISIASIAGVLLLAALGYFLYFQSQFGQYNDVQYKFSVKYPKAWELKIAPQPTVAVVFVSRKETKLDTLQENINITVQEVPAHLASLKTFSDKIIQQMTAVFKQNITVVENVPVTFGGRKGQRLVFQAPKPDNLEMTIAWTIKGDKAYILTYLGSMFKHEQYAPLVEETIKSFQLK